ncbi:uncharacterized protein BN496_01616 [Bacteroides sp. CAG:144]|nr:uncharacterized protein BN496_01616 [Bacteroides sp. CAG:144]
MYRLRDVSGHVEGYLVSETFWEIMAYLLHCRLDALGNLHGIGSGEHVYVQYGGIPSVDTALGIIGGGFEGDASYITQTDNGPVGVGPHDNVFELIHGR